MGIETLANRDRHRGVIHQDPQHRHGPQQQQTIQHLIQRLDLAEHIARYSIGSLPQNMGPSSDRFRRQEGISLSLPQPWLNYLGGRSSGESDRPLLASSNFSESVSESSIQRSESQTPSIKPSFDRTDSDKPATSFTIRRTPLGKSIAAVSTDPSHQQGPQLSEASLPLSLPQASAEPSPALATSSEIARSPESPTTLYRLADVTASTPPASQAVATRLDANIIRTKPIATSQLQAAPLIDRQSIPTQQAPQTSPDSTAPTPLQTAITTPAIDSPQIRRLVSSPLELNAKPRPSINISSLETPSDRHPSQIQSHPIEMLLVQSPRQTPGQTIGQLQRSTTSVGHTSPLASSLPLTQPERIMRVETESSSASPSSAINSPRSEASNMAQTVETHPAVIAEQVSRILARQLAVERERRGIMP